MHASKHMNTFLKLAKIWPAGTSEHNGQLYTPGCAHADVHNTGRVARMRVRDPAFARMCV